MCRWKSGHLLWGQTTHVLRILIFSFFVNIITHFCCYISHSCLAGVTAAKLRWHLPYIDVFQRIWHAGHICTNNKAVTFHTSQRHNKSGNKSTWAAHSTVTDGLRPQITHINIAMYVLLCGESTWTPCHQQIARINDWSYGTHSHGIVSRERNTSLHRNAVMTWHAVLASDPIISLNLLKRAKISIEDNLTLVGPGNLK